MQKSYLCLFFGLFLAMSGYAQIHWYSPADAPVYVIQDQGWPDELKGKYLRLPERAREKIRPELWQLSRQSAGLSIRFHSNAPQITVRYQVEGPYAMPHMPTTGVSGIDLYAWDKNGKELWCAGNYSFGDTIRYTFNSLTYSSSDKQDYEYCLYLPLYNSIKWLEIGVPEKSNFAFVSLRPEKPIVVYGTSIAQGACASRPGMCWTSMLGRKLDYPVVNLGFSGNGRLEEEFISLLNEVDASLYVLDCMPNLTNRSPEEITDLLIQAVNQIREKHPATPILITEHDGYANQYTNQQQAKAYQKTNEASRQALTNLKAIGISQLYLLTYEEIGMPQEATVDGVHPTDYGMVCYASAYEKKIKEILRMPQGTTPATIPVRQQRDFPFYDWQKRHAEILRLNSQQPPRSIIIGNSITHYWGGLPMAPVQRGPESWAKYMEPQGFHNLGFGWDKIENMLWRINHGELDGYKAEKIILLAGTNNLGSDNDEEILRGLDTLIHAVRYHQPTAKIILCGILPRRKMEKRIHELNRKIHKLAQHQKINYVNPGHDLLTSRGTIDETLFIDGLHPNEKGYSKIGAKLIH